jgi:hypothetical protein
MRKESTTIARAFLNRKPKQAARTTTDGNTLLLHGNRIAWHNPDGSISMTLAGWGTPTTRDRLNTLCWLLLGERPFHQVKHVQHYDGTPISDVDTFTFHPVFDEHKIAA